MEISRTKSVLKLKDHDINMGTLMKHMPYSFPTDIAAQAQRESQEQEDGTPDGVGKMEEDSEEEQTTVLKGEDLIMDLNEPEPEQVIEVEQTKPPEPQIEPIVTPEKKTTPKVIQPTNDLSIAIKHKPKKKVKTKGKQ